jgi:excisionase family DNA binding protein
MLAECGRFFRIPALPLNNFMKSVINADISSKEFLTPDELAAILAISRATVYRIIARRQIAFIKVGGSLRFRRVDIEKYIESNCINPLTM